MTNNYTERYRNTCISIASMIADQLVWDGMLGKDHATLVFDALAEGLIQRDESLVALQDMESLLQARRDSDQVGEYAYNEE